MEYRHNKKIVPLAQLLRKEMTREEKHLWYDFLRTHPSRFRRQKIFDNYIVDFYSASAGLVIEVDGSQHFTDEGLLYDAQRTAFLKSLGLRVIRIPNNEVFSNFDGVCEYINQAIQEQKD